MPIPIALTPELMENNFGVQRELSLLSYLWIGDGGQMARCRECNARVWRSAEYCQRCGVRYPAKGYLLTDTLDAKPSRFRISTPIGIVVLGIILFAIAKSGGGPTAPSCRSDWSLCADNSDLVNDYLSNHSAQDACKNEAERQAKYGDPKFPFLFYFDTFYKGDQYPKTGIAILIEKDAQFQNGFGAMVHSEVTCNYDLRAKHVVTILIAPR